MKLRSRVILALALSLGWIATLLAGCSRNHYRQQANAEVDDLIAEKSNNPRWAYPGYTIAMDGRARYFDFTNPDRPPMPIDDPASHQFMEVVDGMRAFPWDRAGVNPNLHNPWWREMLPSYVKTNEQCEVVLDLESAVRLGLIHSSDYRSQVEELYLSSLDVSTERFRFDVQFYGGTGSLFSHLGRNRTANGQTSDTLTQATAGQFQRKIATGGQLLVGFANSFVFQFAGDDTTRTNSILNFSFVQPLLKAGGRAVALEQLTIAERALLANLRAFQRYRQGFYTNVVIGVAGVQGPQRRGGFFGGTGLTGFSGQGSGGFGELGNVTGFGRGNGGAGNTGGGSGAGFAGGGAGVVGGYVGLLQLLQQLRNAQATLNQELRTLDLLVANQQAGLIDGVQVDQFRQNIETDRAVLIQNEVALENQFDLYKLGTLSLPPSIPMTLDDTMIRRFQFIAPQTSAYQDRLDDFITRLGQTPELPQVEQLAQLGDQYADIRTNAQSLFELVNQDLQGLTENTDERLAAMNDEESQLFSGTVQELRSALMDLEERYARSNPALEKWRQSLDQTAPAKAANALVGLASELQRLVQELSLVQARARVETVTIEPVELTSEAALEIARVSRLDWMNNRAALVDTWRLIQFNANALRSNLTVTFTGDLRTAQNNPVSFSGQSGALSAGLQFDPPFTRLLERNNYVAVLTDYQRDRRSLIQYEDTVNQSLRQDLRQLRQLQQNLEIQRRAVVIAIRRVDQTREVLNQPPPASQPGIPATQLGPTAALNLLTALADLRNSQNNFMSVWLNYYAQRMILMRDLGIMEIDDQGLWVDRPIWELVECVEDMYPLPPAVPFEWLRDAGIAEGVGEVLPGVPPRNPIDNSPGLELPPPPPKPDDAELKGGDGPKLLPLQHRAPVSPLLDGNLRDPAPKPPLKLLEHTVPDVTQASYVAPMAEVSGSEANLGPGTPRLMMRPEEAANSLRTSTE